MIAIRIADDADLLKFALTCKDFATAIVLEKSTVWRARFLDRYDHPLIEGPYEFRVAYQLREFVLKMFPSFAGKHAGRGRMALEVLRDMVLGKSFGFWFASCPLTWALDKDSSSCGYHHPSTIKHQPIADRRSPMQKHITIPTRPKVPIHETWIHSQVQRVLRTWKSFCHRPSMPTGQQGMADPMDSLQHCRFSSRIWCSTHGPILQPRYEPHVRTMI
jgi:hypothetical protein